MSVFCTTWGKRPSKIRVEMDKKKVDKFRLDMTVAPRAVVQQCIY